MEHLRTLLDQLGDAVGDDSLTRGVLVVASAALGLATILVALRRPKSAERVRVNVDAPKGERVSVTIGDETENV